MFTSQRFIEAWKEWCTYRKEQHNFEYKSSISEQKAIKTLHNFVAGNEGVALKTIDHSIANGWKGFFEIPPPPQREKYIPIVAPIQTEQTYEIASKESAKKHLAAIKETLRKNGGIGKPKPAEEYTLSRRFQLFKNNEHWCPYQTKQKLLFELKQFPDKYKEEIKYMEK